MRWVYFAMAINWLVFSALPLYCSYLAATKNDITTSVFFTIMFGAFLFLFAHDISVFYDRKQKPGASND